VRGTAHPREELAALALGALEPEEAATVRAHVEGCPACREELDRLAALPALLDLVPGLAAEGVAPAPAALEDAVLARIDDARRTAPPRARPRRRFALRIAAPAWGLAGAALAVGALALAGQLGGGSEGPAPDRIVALRGPDGTARVALTEEPAGTRVALRVDGLAPTRGGQVYELWFSRGRDRVSAGTFTVGGDGSATAQLTTAVAVPDAQRVWITREPNPDDPAPNGPTVLRARLA